MIKTISEYIKCIKNLQVNGVYAYRGQSCSKWQLESSAIRRIRGTLSNDERLETRYLEYHYRNLLERARSRGFGSDGERTLSDLEILAQLQHLGAATALIDFTYDPLIALWFASMGRGQDGKVFIVEISNTEMFRKVTHDQLINEEASFYLDPENRSLWYWEPTPTRDADHRIVRQRSVFVFGGPFSPKNAVNNEIIINGANKDSIQKELNTIFNIQEDTLFIDINGFASSNSVSHDLYVLVPHDYLKFGNEKYQRGRFKDAIHDYTKAIDLNPYYFQAYISRGNARANIGQEVEAIEDYTMVVDSEKSNSALFRWLAYFNRGNAYTQLCKYDSAISDYNKALEMKMVSRGGNTYNLNQPVGGKGITYFNRGNAYTLNKQYRKSVSDYEQAIEHGYQTYFCYFNYGNAQIRDGDLRGALKSYIYSDAVSGNEHASLNCKATQEVLDFFGDKDINAEEIFIDESSHSPAHQESPNIRIRAFNGNKGSTGSFGVGSTGGKGLQGASGFIMKFTV